MSLAADLLTDSLRIDALWKWRVSTSLMRIEFYTFAQCVIPHESQSEHISLTSLPAFDGKSIKRF